MRVVLDINVLVAALLTQGVAAQVVDLWLAGRYTCLLYTSDAADE